MNVYDEFGSLQNTTMNRGFMDFLLGTPRSNIPSPSVLRKFDLDVDSHDGKTFDIVRKCAKNMSIYVELKLEERVQQDLVASSRACFTSMEKMDKESKQKQSTAGERKVSVAKRSNSIIAQVYHTPLYCSNANNDIKRQRSNLARVYLQNRPAWTVNDFSSRTLKSKTKRREYINED